MTPSAIWFLLSIVGVVIFAGVVLRLLERPAVLRAFPGLRADPAIGSVGIQLILLVSGVIVVVAGAVEKVWPAVFIGVAFAAIGSAPFFPNARARTVVRWTGMTLLFGFLILTIVG